VTQALTRRRFLRLSATAAGLGLLSACAPAAQPAPTAASQATAAPKATEAPKPAATTAPAAQATQAPAATAKPAAGPKRGGTLTLARVTGIQEFNPFALNPGTYPILHAIWNTLASYDQKLNPQPELAEKWDLAADGKSVTLKLREGVKFHTGRDFTSADVQPSLEFGQTNERSIMAALLKSVSKVETPDKYTVTLRFAEPTPLVFDVLDVLYIIDKEVIDKRANSASGTGPFKLDTYIPNDRAELGAFKDYWDKGKPYLDKYIVRQVPDTSALSINLESGTVDCIFNPAYVDIVRLKSAGKFAIDMGTPGTSMFDVGINVSVEPFTDKRVRQAIGWSIDRARFCRTTLQGLVEPTCLMWPKHSWAYFADLEGKLGFDLDKAKALLTEAGLGNGFTFELYASTAQIPNSADMAQIMQADLKKIGVNAKVSDLEGAQYQMHNQTKRDSVVIAHSYGRGARDPGSLLTGAKSWYTDKEASWTHFDNPQYEKLRQDLQTVLDRDKRKAIARQIQELALDECFTIPVAPSPKPFVYWNHVKDFVYNLEDSPFLANVWLDK
jgi:peptide/nickel transport system substrate-binding protein